MPINLMLEKLAEIGTQAIQAAPLLPVNSQCSMFSSASAPAAIGMSQGNARCIRASKRQNTVVFVANR